MDRGTGSEGSAQSSPVPSHMDPRRQGRATDGDGAARQRTDTDHGCQLSESGVRSPVNQRPQVWPDSRTPDPLLQCSVSRAACGTEYWGRQLELPVARLKRWKATIDDGRRVGIDGPPVPRVSASSSGRNQPPTPTANRLSVVPYRGRDSREWGCRQRLGSRCRESTRKHCRWGWAQVCFGDVARCVGVGGIERVVGCDGRWPAQEDGCRGQRTEDSTDFEWREARDRRPWKSWKSSMLEQADPEIKARRPRMSWPLDPGLRHPTVAIPANATLRSRPRPTCPR
ncbi:hypothetical protein QBC39DRAFT_357066 [Podospora conica]|nr:hypothetical protein QBC39DRAFT_357066 [Schizothecium conicum]